MDPDSTCWQVRRGLPACGEDCHVLLPLPDIRQATNWSCGDAAIKCVLTYHRIVAPAKLATSIDGLEPAGIERHLRRIGLHVLAGSLHTDDLAHFCDAGKPPIVLATWPDDGESHWCVVRGVSRGRVYIHCPTSGPESYRQSEWDAIWRASGRLGEQYHRWGVVGWPANGAS